MRLAKCAFRIPTRLAWNSQRQVQYISAKVCTRDKYTLFGVTDRSIHDSQSWICSSFSPLHNQKPCFFVLFKHIANLISQKLSSLLGGKSDIVEVGSNISTVKIILD